MEWLGSIKGSIDYIEKHLLEDISAQDVAKEQNMSPFYLQQGFRLMTGYTIGEYIRNRRLYLAGLEAFSGKMKVIDLAYRYGYDTPESFAKAFKRFHGVSPAQIRGDSSKIKVFLPLKISIILQGGFDMEYTAEKMSSFSVVGFEREFSFETSYRDIPQYWQEIFQTYQKPMMEGKKPETDIQKAMCEYRIGQFGVCLDGDAKDGRFRYLIAGKYNGGAVPDGMVVHEFPEIEWVKFRCVGPLPGALQSVNTMIFREWLPTNTEFEIALNANIEWYSSEGCTSDDDYESAVWIPVRRK